jgi:hypothetical protein
MAESDIFVARESFTCEVDGQDEHITRGITRVRAGHPILKGREDLFEPLKVQYDIERATAAPGEKRQGPAGKARNGRKAAEKAPEKEKGPAGKAPDSADA